MTYRLHCELCDFSEPCTLKEYFVHFGVHLKNKETVKCPFQQCLFNSNVYSSFRAHKSRYHCSSELKDLRAELIYDCDPPAAISGECNVTAPIDIDVSHDEFEHVSGESVKLKLASLFLRMQTLLHVSKSATQDIVDELYEIGTLAGECTKTSIENVLRQHNCNIEGTTLALITEAIQGTNPLGFLSRSGPFGTDHKRSTFFKDNFPVIEPVEYVIDADRKKTFVYVPILSVLTELLSRNDVLDKVLAEESCSELQSGQFKSFRDGLFFKENPLLSGDELSIAVGLYIDDFEVCNPLGTSRKKHKVCALYWVIANLPIKYRSALSSIYLAVFCKSDDLKTFGYTQILDPLLKDLQILENQGVFIQRLGQILKGRCFLSLQITWELILLLVFRSRLM